MFNGNTPVWAGLQVPVLCGKLGNWEKECLWQFFKLTCRIVSLFQNLKLISNPNEWYIFPALTTGLQTFSLIENCTPEHNFVGVCAGEAKSVKEEKSGLAAQIKALAPDVEGIHCRICPADPTARQYATDCPHETFKNLKTYRFWMGSHRRLLPMLKRIIKLFWFINTYYLEYIFCF
jgi:hypothetical protein